MRHTRKILYTLLGVGLAVVLMAMLFRGTDWGALRTALREVELGWLLASALAFLVANAIRGLRMWPVLSARAPIRLSLVFNATQISQLANMALPVRSGPLLRALAIARITGRPFSYLAGASFGDRCVEGAVLSIVMTFVGLILLIGAVIPAGPAPQAAALSLLGLAAACVGLATVLFLVTRERRGPPAPWAAAVARRFAARAHAAWAGLRDGVRESMFSRHAWSSWLGSALAWSGNMFGFAAMLQAYSIDAVWIVPVLGSVLTIVTFILPGAPGLVGPYHAAVIAALAMGHPESSHELRLAVAIVLHATHISIIALLGVVGLLAEHQSLFALEAAEDALAEAPPPSQDDPTENAP